MNLRLIALLTNPLNPNKLIFSRAFSSKSDTNFRFPGQWQEAEGKSSLEAVLPPEISRKIKQPDTSIEEHRAFLALIKSKENHPTTNNDAYDKKLAKEDSNRYSLLRF